MSLDHILLGLLREPQSGYDLKKAFDTVFSHFWSAEISQIYRQLKGLERKGHLHSWTEPSPKGPPRRLYETTPSGRRELVDWLKQGPLFADRRVPYLAQILFLDELGDVGATIDFLERLRDDLRARLQLMRDIDTEIRTEEEEMAGPQDLLGQLLINHGLHRWRALLEWAEESLELLRREAPRPTTTSRAGDVDESTSEPRGENP